MLFQGGASYGGNGFEGGGRGGRGGGRGGGRYGDDQTDISSEQFRKLFVGGLSYETDEKSLRSHFEQWGEIADCIVMRDPDTKRSRGFGFITYKESFMIDKAQKNRPHKIDNREVETKRAMPRNADGSSNHQSVKKMFVGGLKDDTTEEQMRDVFGKFGEIDSVNILADTAPGKCRGFAFITYKDYDSVDRAVLLKKHDLNTRRVEVKKAVPKYQMNGSGRGGGSVWWGRGRGLGSCGYSFNAAFRGGYGGGSFGGSNGGYGGGYAGGQNWGGLSGYGNHRGGYGGGSFGGIGGGYGGGYAGGQNWGGSSGYGNHNSSWGRGGVASGLASNYGGNYGGSQVKGGSCGPVKGGSSGPVESGSSGPVKGGSRGPTKSSSDTQLVAKDPMEVAMDTLTVAAAAMVVVDSDNQVTTEASENPEHMNIQEVNPKKRKRRQEKPQSSQRLMLSREMQKTELSVEKHHHDEPEL